MTATSRPRELGRTAVAKTTQIAIRHLPPRRKGLSFANRVERFISPPVRPQRATHVSGFSITCDLADSVQRSLYYKGTVEERASAVLLEALGPGDQFLDVGANCGHYTFLAAAAVGSGGIVHAVEASPATALQLAQDVSRNGLNDRVTVHAVAVADVKGSLFLQEAPGPSPYGMRYLDPDARQGTEVQVTTIDELLPELSPAAVKVDVEGADLRALRGMSRMLTERPPRLILCEAIDSQLARFADDTEQLVDFVVQFGYQVADVTDHVGARELAFTR